jgi:hypothetical protein
MQSQLAVPQHKRRAIHNRKASNNCKINNPLEDDISKKGDYNVIYVAELCLVYFI